MIGQTIGNYVVRDKIGEGGMGVVYVAEHPRIGRKVAIKVLLPEYSQNEEVVGRFFTEARASSAIKNEHIIDIIDFGELPDKSSYIIMEWLEGRSLTEVLERDKSLPVERALHIATGIGRALAAAHHNGIVHRDLKPDNIFLVARGDDRDFAKVLDFGVAKLLDAPGRDAPPPLGSKTRTGAIIGTPMYMSPEQCRGVQVDARSDIYALAVIVYEMLAGRLPFHAEGLGDLLLAHMTETPKLLREVVPVPEAVELAVAHALQKEPNQRPARMEDFIGELTGRAPSIVTPARVSTAMASQKSGVDTIGAAVGQTVRRPAVARSRWPYVVVPLLAVSAAAAFVLREPKPTPTLHPQTMTTPAPVTTVPVVRKPTTPARVHLALRATPPEAQITFDGAPRQNPYGEDVTPDNREHHVVMVADGYQPYETTLTLDGPREVAHELTKLAHGDRRGMGKTLPSLPTSQTAKPHPESSADAPAPKTSTPSTPATSSPPSSQSTNTKKNGPTIYKGTKGTLMTDDPFK